jgi:hypothetical protein
MQSSTGRARAPFLGEKEGSVRGEKQPPPHRTAGERHGNKKK